MARISQFSKKESNQCGSDDFAERERAEFFARNDMMSATLLPSAISGARSKHGWNPNQKTTGTGSKVSRRQSMASTGERAAVHESTTESHVCLAFSWSTCFRATKACLEAPTCTRVSPNNSKPQPNLSKIILVGGKERKFRGEKLLFPTGTCATSSIEIFSVQNLE